MGSPTESAVRIVQLFPDLLGTYGDGGNATVLAKRLEWRDLAHELITLESGSPIPTDGDLYLLGGGEDGPQVEAARELAQSRALHRAVERGAVVFAVCAGMQILGHQFPDARGEPKPGLALLDIQTVRLNRPRAVGELLVHPDPCWGLPELTGFENHGGRTRLGPAARALGRVEVGEGNGWGDEGAVSGRVVGTYLHGPALARNPALADLLLSWIVGALTPLDDREVEALREERIRAARQRQLQPRRSWKDLIRRA
ncbi:MAG: hypothetical protein WHS89_10900 [Acidimicrobiales bacterium]|jgi:hypothetical protein